MNDDTVNKAIQIQRLRKEVEKIRERNMDLIEEIHPFDDFMYKAHKKISHFLDGASYSDYYSDSYYSDSAESDADFKISAQNEELPCERKIYKNRGRPRKELQIFNMDKKSTYNLSFPIYYSPPSIYDIELQRNIASHKP